MELTKDELEEFLFAEDFPGETLTHTEYGVLQYYSSYYDYPDEYKKCDLYTYLDSWRYTPGNFIRDIIVDRLPRSPEDATRGIWSDGEEILCKTEAQADAIADLLDTLGSESHTGYYDPEEDRRNDETDNHTGWHYVDWD